MLNIVIWFRIGAKNRNTAQMKGLQNHLWTYHSLHAELVIDAFPLCVEYRVGLK